MTRNQTAAAADAARPVSLWRKFVRVLLRALSACCA